MKKTPFDSIPKDALDQGAHLTTISALRPGAICSLMYKNKLGTGRRLEVKAFTVMVVSNSRTGLGSVMFEHKSPGKVKDKYLSCFIVDHLQFETINSIRTSIDKYRKQLGDGRKAKTYRYVKSLFGLLIGKDKYRTLSVTEGSISSVVRYDIQYYQKVLENG